jgi:hypothetical protein
MKKSVWYVAHVIHVRTPYVYTPRLFVTDVPEGTSKSHLWDLIDEYEEFGEFGVLHANHCLCPLDKDSPPSVKRAWRGQDESYDDYPVKRVSYDELKKLKETI